MTSRRSFLLAGAACGLAQSPLIAMAQDSYPSRRIEIIVPFPAGGTADFLGRVIAQKLSDERGQPVVVNNKPGATGGLGADLAARSAPDGYTLLLTSYPHRGILFRPEAPVPDPTRDVVPVALIAKPPLILVAHPSLGASNVRELIAIAKEKKGALNYASIGPGTPSHLAMELFERAVGIDMVHVPYKGSSQALSDVVGGIVPLMFDSVVSSLGHVKAGRLRALGVSTAARLPTLPEVPTIAESGVPGFDVSTWAVLYAPPLTPPAIVERLNGMVNEILQRKDVSEMLAVQGSIVPPPMRPAEVAAFVRDDVKKWRKLVAEAHIQGES